jgi:SAM-dependent methyltransferase
MSASYALGQTAGNDHSSAYSKLFTCLLYLRKIAVVLAKGIPWVVLSRFRVCRCCRRLSFIICFGPGDERKKCIRCRANLRYELLAEAVRKLAFDPDEAVVVEFDPNSALRREFAHYRQYTRTFYSSRHSAGYVRPDGAICEDITKLTFPDHSVDAMITSEVLEHVPEIRAAFKETARVLKKNGVHIFTVPTRNATRQRASLEADGAVRYLDEPEMHSDPLNPRGILVFWDIGPDLPSFLNLPELTFEVLGGQEGRDRRFVWCARRRPQ